MWCLSTCPEAVVHAMVSELYVECAAVLPTLTADVDSTSVLMHYGPHSSYIHRSPGARILYGVGFGHCVIAKRRSITCIRTQPD